ncbi:ABC transporter permease [Solobacterium sp.]|uniref:ABC transporter permease n=1 Tax=Solobacterium sp. TaxID=2060878 RepID=UPI001CABF6FB|nr:ABC transporter permease [Solobacterium sp.]MBF1086084.1 ABC transporter permease [Solobacterium sp.]MBF1102240.1 ABC transporter permease [Solobacterium sp.]MBF1109909.1 ABC transporter permease [Solobacterium sp.]
MKNKNKKSSEGLKSLSASLLCIFGGIFVGFVVLVLLSVFNPRIGFAEAVRGILIVLGGPFSGGGNSLFQFGNMLFNATPLILTGLSACIAFKTGLFNIGAPGQYLMGAMVTLIVSLSIPSATVPSPVIWLLALICGTLAGALWGAIPGFFKAYLNVNEVIVCIMTNWIAANVVSWVFNGSKFINVAESKVNFIMKTEVNNIATATFGLDKIFSGGSVVSYADASIFLAICVAIALYIVMNKTTFGYELKACGYNRDGAKYAGMNEKRNLLLAMAIAGGLAAMGASIWCLNGHQDFKWETYQILPADGFNGIPAALLAGNNPIGIIFTAIFLKYINVGGSNLAANTAFNEYVSQLMVAMIVYFSGFARYISMLLSTKKKSLQEIETEIKNSKEEKK